VGENPPTSDAAPTPPNAPKSPLTPYVAPEGYVPRMWGEPARESDWLKVRSLVGKTFKLSRISKATITPKKGANAGSERASFVLELLDGHLFSVNEEDSIGHQLSGMGTPNVGSEHTFTIVSQPSTASRTGDALLLREVRA